MNTVLNLATLNPDRFFIIGGLKGSYARLIHLLFHQRASYKDIVVFTGDLTEENTEDSLNTLFFIKNTVNMYSVKGKVEKNLIELLSEGNKEKLPLWLRNYEDTDEVLNYLKELPSIVLLPNDFYVVNAGLEPLKSVYDQDPEAFYSIGDYDKNSKYYQFENPGGKSWFQFEFYNGPSLMKICSGNKSESEIEVPAGYLLGRETTESLKSLVIKSDQPSPIFIES